MFPYPPDRPTIYVHMYNMYICADAGKKGQGHERGHGSLGY